MPNNTDGKIKIYKNADRNKPAPYKPYVPQYQVHGVEPGEYQSAVVPSNTKVAGPTALPLDNPRGKRPAMRQPYASEVPSPIGRGKGPVPNVGNNMEHTWSGADSEMVDDLSDVDMNQAMIDNNEYVDIESLQFQNGPTAADLHPQYEAYPATMLENEVVASRQPTNPEDLMPVLADLDYDSYLLIVSGVPVCSGPKEELEDQARALVFGEHEMCDGNPVPVDDIIILKRVKVKVGLFLE